MAGFDPWINCKNTAKYVVFWILLEILVNLSADSRVKYLQLICRKGASIILQGCKAWRLPLVARCQGFHSQYDGTFGGPLWLQNREAFCCSTELWCLPWSRRWKHKLDIPACWDLIRFGFDIPTGRLNKNLIEDLKSWTWIKILKSTDFNIFIQVRLG